MSPAIPAAPSACPKLLLTEPSATLPPPRPLVSSPSAWASMKSPSSVPVPCASTKRMSSAVRPARRHTDSISRCCAQRLGAVMPLLRPSWLIPVSFSTAYTG